MSTPSSTTPSILGDLNPADFLRDYWQKKPLLIRQALPNFVSPFTPEELAGLACELGVEARLILERDGDTPWQVKHSPLQEQDFIATPASHWTVLVQQVNHHVPEVADLLDYFTFLPAWRIDDIMVSYAASQGSVGAHTDSYDVFLFQAMGKRRWQISHDNGALLPDIELRILQTFTPEQEWVLEAGDMLYLPPQLAHHGVALEPGMTFSIGFLAPCYRDMLLDYIDHAATQVDPSARYADPNLQLPTHAGAIAPEALHQVQQTIRQLPLDDASINHWFGRFVSESRAGTTYPTPQPPYTMETWQAEFAQTGYLRRWARMVFIDDERGRTLFAEGQAFALSTDQHFLAPLLTQQRDFAYTQLNPQLNPTACQLLVDLTNQGFLYFYTE